MISWHGSDEEDGAYAVTADGVYTVRRTYFLSPATNVFDVPRVIGQFEPIKGRSVSKVFDTFEQGVDWVGHHALKLHTDARETHERLIRAARAELAKPSRKGRVG